MILCEAKQSFTKKRNRYRKTNTDILLKSKKHYGNNPVWSGHGMFVRFRLICIAIKSDNVDGKVPSRLFIGPEGGSSDRDEGWMRRQGKPLTRMVCARPLGTSVTNLLKSSSTPWATAVNSVDMVVTQRQHPPNRSPPHPQPALSH